jgi:plasmid stability protein
MATLTIRNVPESLHNALRKRAEAQARSVEAEVRALLEAGVRAPGADWRKELPQIQARARKAMGKAPKGAVQRFVAERRADWDDE